MESPHDKEEEPAPHTWATVLPLMETAEARMLLEFAFYPMIFFFQSYAWFTRTPVRHYLLFYTLLLFIPSILMTVLHVFIQPSFEETCCYCSGVPHTKGDCDDAAAPILQEPLCSDHETGVRRHCAKYNTAGWALVGASYVSIGMAALLHLYNYIRRYPELVDNVKGAKLLAFFCTACAILLVPYGRQAKVSGQAIWAARVSTWIFIGLLTLYWTAVRPLTRAWCCYSTSIYGMDFGMCDADDAPINNALAGLKRPCSAVTNGEIVYLSVLGASFLSALVSQGIVIISALEDVDKWHTQRVEQPPSYDEAVGPAPPYEEAEEKDKQKTPTAPVLGGSN